MAEAFRILLDRLVATKDETFYKELEELFFKKYDVKDFGTLTDKFIREGTLVKRPVELEAFLKLHFWKLERLLTLGHV